MLSILKNLQQVVGNQPETATTVTSVKEIDRSSGEPATGDNDVDASETNYIFNQPVTGLFILTKITTSCIGCTRCTKRTYK